MKLTTNLTTEQVFSTYPYTIIDELFKDQGPHFRITTDNFRDAYEHGFDVSGLLIKIHDNISKMKQVEPQSFIRCMLNIYTSCVKYDLPDPSHAIPIDLSSARLERVINVYKVGIDASFFATNDMPVSYMSSLSKWLVESALEMKNWNRHALKQIKLTFE